MAIEKAAYEFVESSLWPDGPVCPRCASRHVGTLQGRSTRIGVYKCYGCRKPFTVKIGTVFEGSHIPMHKWVAALGLHDCQNLGAHRLAEELDVGLRTAFRMSHLLKLVSPDFVEKFK